MESLLWVLQLLSIAALCRWALKQESREEKEAGEGKQRQGSKRA